MLRSCSFTDAYVNENSKIPGEALVLQRDDTRGAACWCAVPRGCCSSVQGMLHREVLPSRDVLTHHGRIHTAFCSYELRRAELEFSVKMLFLKKIQFLKAGEMVPFCSFNWEKNLP